MRLRGRSVVACAASCALIACDGERRIQSPSDLGWVAVVSRADDGTINASGLADPRGTALRFVATPNATSVAIGYRSDFLAGVTLPSAEVLASHALRPAIECDPALPPPDWSESIRGGQHFQPGLDPPLTTDWLNNLCPGIEALSIGSDCQSCSPRVVAVGCTVTIDFTACGGTVSSLLFDYRGSACLLRGAVHPCRLLSTGSTVARTRARLTRLECPVNSADVSCTFSVYEGFDPAPIATEVAAIPGPLARLDPFSEAHPYGPAAQAGLGNTWDLAVISSSIGPPTIAVSGTRAGHAYYCTGPDADRRLWFFDGDLRLIRTSTPPECLVHLLGDPAQPGTFLGAYGFKGGDPPLRLGRFDRSGAILASTDLPISRFVEPQSGASQIFGALSWIHPGTLWLAPVRQSAPFTLLSPNASYLLQYNTRLSTVAAPLMLSDFQPSSVLPLDSGFAVAVEGYAVLLVDAVGNVQRVPQTFPDDAPHYGPILAPPGLGSLASLINGPLSGMIEVRNGAFGRLAQTSAGVPTALAPWPADPQLVLVALGVGAPDYPSRLALFDLANWRFLPGEVEVRSGDAPLFGPIIELLPDGEGHIVGLAPWSSALVRISPR